MDKAKHAFGTLEGIDAALSAGKIDSYDVLFVKDANGKPYVGWIDKEGNKVIVDDSAELAALEKEIAAKVDAKEVETLESAIATKANTSDVETLETELATKVTAEEVKTMIRESGDSSVEIVEF